MSEPQAIREVGALAFTSLASEQPVRCTGNAFGQGRASIRRGAVCNQLERQQLIPRYVRSVIGQLQLLLLACCI
jgi:hypothetical protein